MIYDNHFNVENIPDYLTKEKLEKFYNWALYNLKVSPNKLEWIKPSELPYIEPRSWVVVGDAYLKNSEADNYLLAKDLLDNGTYWSINIFVDKNENNNVSYRLRDGVHRVHLIKMLNKQGLWKDDRKILVKTDELKETYTGEDIKFAIPSPHIVTDKFIQKYQFLYDTVNAKGIKYLDEECEIVEFKHPTGYLCQVMFSYLLRNAFFEYQSKYGEIIKPSPYINDEAKFNEWINII